MCRSSTVHRLLVIGSLWLGLVAGSATNVSAQLADAVMRGDKDVLRALPRDRKAIDAPQPDGTTALALGRSARRSHHCRCADQGRRGREGRRTGTGSRRSSLAATNGNAAMIRALLDAGVDPNTATPGGETALMTAARTGKVDAVTLLLDRGANVNAKDTVHAQTALMWAVIENHTEHGRSCSSHAAPTSTPARTSRCRRASTCPARAGGASGTGIIRQRALPTAERRHDAAAVCGARRQRCDDAAAAGSRRRSSACRPATGPRRCSSRCSTGRSRIATELLERGANPNAADDYHRAALFAAIDLRNFNHEQYTDLPTDGGDPLDLIKALLEKGSDPNTRTDTVPVHGLMQFDASWVNFDGQTPFVRAALVRRHRGDAAVARRTAPTRTSPRRRGRRR